ncbi:hypothetical protein BGZ74_009370 [Mortierella antarctica]|nr:hypothetical protein BGZ74_009370 [Mortierella antarctica]
MNSNETIYLTLGYISVVLFLYLIGHCAYRGINYTLQIFCVVGIINSINETFLVFMHKGQVVAMAGGTAACTTSAIIEQFTPMALNLLATSMAFHIWFVIVWQSSRIELQMLKWYCLVSFGIPLITTSIALILLHNEPYFSAYPRRYYCDFKESHVTIGTFAIPMTLWAVPGILLTCKVVLAHVIFCFAFGMIMVMAMMERLSLAKHMESPTEANLAAFSDFSGSLIGICVFFVFGTTKDSLRTMSNVFCPCRQHIQSNLQLSSDSTASTGETQMVPRSSPRSSPLRRYSDYSLEDVEAAPVALKELVTEPVRSHSPDYRPGRQLSSIGSQDTIMPSPP